MPITIDSTLVPTIAPGNLFSTLTTDDDIEIRFITSLDPVFFGVANRPLADLALRQLIIAKTLDQVEVRLGSQAIFPFLSQPQVTNGSTISDVPLNLIWTMAVSLPKKWERVRLARIKRVSGDNGGTDATAAATGVLRFVFTAQQEGSSTEVSVFQADYDISSLLTYQLVRVDIPTSMEESVVVSTGEQETIDGFITFRTLDLDDEVNLDFLDVVAPPADTTTGSNGEFTSPAIHEISDSIAGGSAVEGDFDLSAVSHGTGMLVDHATNPIPSLDSDAATWLSAFNYPFDLEANRTSTSPAGITIPQGLFQEFDVTAPAGDRPESDLTGQTYPVFIQSITRNDATADSLTFTFATFNTTDTPSIVPVEFATLTLTRDGSAGEVVSIVPNDNLKLESGSDADNFQQGFGKGHVRLSSLWDGSSTVVDDFFDSFLSILADPAEVLFGEENTRVSSYGVSRVPGTIPTVGEAQALKGSRAGEDDPSSANRYVVEADEGLTSTITLTDNGFASLSTIQNVAYIGGLVNKKVIMVIDGKTISEMNPGSAFYTNEILPRLTFLLGRAPITFDQWFDGTRVKTFIKLSSTDEGTWVG